jgi:electron transport complex protein RnfD
MKIDGNKMLTGSSSPHIKEGTRTATIMWTVSLCLLPAAVWGIFMFGLYALLTLLVSISSALLAEFIICAIRGKVTVLDGSAFLTGFLIGLNMPPSVPVYVPVCAALFAIAIVKQAFGGLGANFMNPALAGRVFVMFSFPKAMNSWQLPWTLLPGLSGNDAVNASTAASVDAITGATPLGAIKTGIAGLAAQYPDSAGLKAGLHAIGGPMQMLAGSNYPVTGFDTQVTGWINGTFGVQLTPGYVDLFFGNVAGCIGEISVILLLIGAAVLFFRKIISWEIPVLYLGSFAILVWLFGGFIFDRGFFTGDAVFELFSGGLILGAFFMATDSVTSPLTRRGKIIFGVGAGFLTFLIRFFGSLPEGVALAIIIMNMFVPLIDRFMKPKIFGKDIGENRGIVA